MADVSFTLVLISRGREGNPVLGFMILTLEKRLCKTEAYTYHKDDYLLR